MDLNNWLNNQAATGGAWNFPVQVVNADDPTQSLPQGDAKGKVPLYPWGPAEGAKRSDGERDRPTQRLGVGELEMPSRKTFWQAMRPSSCEDTEAALSTQWGQDFLGQGFFPLSCPTLQAPALGHVQVPNTEPLGQPCQDFNYEDFLLREEKLIARIKEFMESPKHNPDKGSIPSERVQNCIKQKHKELYNFVVSTVYANQWHRFIRKHDDTFELIFTKDEGRSLPRIRLRMHENYEAADRREEDERRRRECVILNCLKQYLEDHNDDVRVEDFRTEYQRWLNEDHAAIRTADERWRKLDHPPYEDPPPALPRFRDIIRIVKRHPEDFGYDPNTEEAGQNARIRSASTWKPQEQARLYSAFAPNESRPEIQVPLSAPARISQKSSLSAVTFPPRSAEDDVFFSMPQSGPVQKPRQDLSKELKSVPDADPVWQFQERERKLVKEIVDFLDSEEWNPKKGSVPSERVQNCIKAKFPGLYRSVVGAYYSNQWHRFIQSHGGPQGFNLFLVQDGKRAVWRIRLEKHANFQEADEIEKTEREKKEQHQLEALLKYLEDTGGSCKVDEFIAEYEKQLPNKQDLPKRGDFVRFVRRYTEHFEYDSTEFIITCPRIQGSKGSPKALDYVRVPFVQRPWLSFVTGELVVFLLPSACHAYHLRRRVWLELQVAGLAAAHPEASATSSPAGPVYVVGGLEGTAYSSDVFVFEVVSEVEAKASWKRLETTGEPPAPRGRHSAALRECTLYVLGGVDNDGPSDLELHTLDLKTHSWSGVAAQGGLPPGLHGHAAFMKDGHLYVLGGSEALDHFYAFTFATMSWRREAVEGAAPPGEGTLALLKDRTVCVLNGRQRWSLDLQASPLAWHVANVDDATESGPLIAAFLTGGTIYHFVEHQGAADGTE